VFKIRVIDKGMKKNFFSRTMSATRRAERRNSESAGRYLRRVAMNSMRTVKSASQKKRKKQLVSRPGQPPFARTRFLKNRIFYAWDPAVRKTVVGPAKIGGRVSPNIPEVLEGGGVSRAIVIIDGKRVPSTVRIEARPFMGPALKKTIPQLRGIWKNSIKK
jgi:hypothetical protein